AWPWPNVWLGATVVTQAEADRDVPKLVTTPAGKRFLSIEPMLGPINLEGHLKQLCDAGSVPAPGGGTTCWRCQGNRLFGGCRPIDWVIAGGESGRNARPAPALWFRHLRAQCAAFGVPFLFKQWGEWIPERQASSEQVADYLRTHRNCTTGIADGERVM